ncbi:NAC domain-containing protein 41-like [Tripterygium wilfordii]|uniref:NAC domain-containing protein 41-like n=1 Tax=Tripterygium wilfordii TaxID=458696 RepID=UPI0018F81098|nr:NAC domain-containing protein 41-like [Tripterygium wilfordii]
MCSSSPSEEELVGDYLYNKVHGSPFPQTIDVKECDLYDEEPWEIWDKYGEPELERINGENIRVVLYLFTKLKKQSLNGKRFLRSVGCDGGVWQGEDAPKRIETKSCVGSRKRYRYENAGSDQHGRWIMMEFNLGDYNGKRNDYVLCSLKERGRRKRRVCGEIESKQEQPLKKQKGKEQTASTDPITSEIPPSTPQPCCSVNSMDYSSV